MEFAFPSSPLSLVISFATVNCNIRNLGLFCAVTNVGGGQQIVDSRKSKSRKL